MCGGNVSLGECRGGLENDDLGGVVVVEVEDLSENTKFARTRVCHGEEFIYLVDGAE